MIEASLGFGDAGGQPVRSLNRVVGTMGIEVRTLVISRKAKLLIASLALKLSRGLWGTD